DVDISKNVLFGFSDSVVKVLMDRYLGENHVFYTDNYYTAPALTKYLQERGVGTVGTVRSHVSCF
ncbi:hypothetical protein Pcinc_043697, partial [Petrolisthes cinctipes]